MEIGSVVSIYAATAGYQKYHLCLMLADGANAARFLFINSNPNFDDTMVVPNDRIPCLQENDIGVESVG